MPDIAEKTSQDANVVQQQQKKQIISKKRRSKLLCFLFLFLFKKELKMYLNHERRRITEDLFGQFAHGRKLRNGYMHRDMVCIPKQIHPSKQLGNNSYFFLMIFFSSTDIVITASAGEKETAH